jgi:hypothetical protein
MGCVQTLQHCSQVEGHQRALFTRKLWRNGQVSFSRDVCSTRLIQFRK